MLLSKMSCFQQYLIDVGWWAVSCVNSIDQTQAAQTNLFTKIDILLC